MGKGYLSNYCDSYVKSKDKNYCCCPRAYSVDAKERANSDGMASSSSASNNWQWWVEYKGSVTIKKVQGQETEQKLAVKIGREGLLGERSKGERPKLHLLRDQEEYFNSPHGT